MKHTPGPWFFSGKHEGCEVRYVGTYPDDRFCGELATLFGKDGEEQEANARLIAAAPELLDVLTRMVDQISDPLNAEHQLGAFVLGARIAEARAAIAKATGGQA